MDGDCKEEDDGAGIEPKRVGHSGRGWGRDETGAQVFGTACYSGMTTMELTVVSLFVAVCCLLFVALTPLLEKAPANVNTQGSAHNNQTHTTQHTRAHNTPLHTLKTKN